jgi:hypothetical protein
MDFFRDAKLAVESQDTLAGRVGRQVRRRNAALPLLAAKSESKADGVGLDAAGNNVCVVGGVADSDVCGGVSDDLFANEDDCGGLPPFLEEDVVHPTSSTSIDEIINGINEGMLLGYELSAYCVDYLQSLIYIFFKLLDFSG